MKVAFLHYHLRSGGVTTVIRDQLAAMRESAQCIVLTGEPPAGGLDPALAAAARLVSGIGYVERGQGAGDPRVAADAVRSAMLDAWGVQADILHVHNPTLNKNPAFLTILRLLQEDGIRILAQVHDFAEDGRPAAIFPAGEEYPQDCHYAVINSRDYAVLIAAGLRPEGVHQVWNVVKPPIADKGRAERAARHSATGRESPRLIYPVRGIRRKNIGEAILLATVLPGRLTLTLPPKDEADLERYAAWRDFAGALDLPVRFDAGVDSTLEKLLAEADGALTTSLNEGFGFAFLEPWAAGVPVGGRRIKHVCADFERAGVKLPLLYHALPVPIALFDTASYSLRWRKAVAASFESFGRYLEESHLGKTWSLMTEGGVVDFGALDEQAQREVISRVHADRGARRSMDSQELDELRHGLCETDGPVIEHNRSVIAESYGINRYEALLGTVYKNVVATPVRHRIDRRVLLESFLDPARFRILEQR
jgi:glycosyltransferase involved in cell wall biosynthesis